MWLHDKFFVFFRQATSLDGQATSSRRRNRPMA